jgi:glutathione S-transferase
MLKILGRGTSTNVQKVLWCCDEIGLDYTREDIGGPFGGNDRPEYLALNPNGRVPTLIDGDLVLWESNSIVRYLAAGHDNGGLIPADPAGRALVERWMDWELSTAAKPHGMLMLQLVRTPPAERDPELIESNRVAWAAAMTILDAQLATTPCVAGERFSCADIALGTSAYRWFNLDFERPELPHLASWYARLRERPAYRKHVLIEIV